MSTKITDKFIKDFDKQIVDKIAELKVVGLSVAILHNDDVVYRQNFGARNMEKIQPVNSDTMFNIASTTKSFICFAILKLAEENKLEINDPVSKYVPLELGEPENPITIHHLMNHTSGIPDLTGHTFFHVINSYDLPMPKEAEIRPLVTKSDFYRHLNSGNEWVRKPDEYFQYNNYGYSILADIIEKITEMDFDNYLREVIFDPLRMERATLRIRSKNDDNIAQGYLNYPQGEDKDSKVKPVDYVNEMPILRAAGGIFTSVNELINYMKMHMNYGNFDGNQLLNKELVEVMQNSTLKEDSFAKRRFKSNLGGKGGYGYGFFVENDFFGYKLIHHGGNFIGGTADFMFVPKLKLGIIGLGNNAIGPRNIIRQGLAMLLDKDPKKDMPEVVEQKHLEKLSGIYESFQGTNKIEINIRGGYLIVKDISSRILNTPPKILTPFEEGNFKPTEFYIHNIGDSKELVRFDIKSDEIWLDIVRNRYKKVRDLD